ncbi:uncharacterized protein PHALS_10478 [Plasmopara halstedii]|uniref:Uncharacterized protein n=1 Tax=Plasmopara halstedii TaxID=4781 RepID=A0A0N7L522_PLAHL|nr:uncharacterized protein PHALS_10478 [Plasmopara halstedii]CEG40267.1 hypothetical protein PHALS_10478 [Plasmopara halstedii]|eukprot:XP_024576636.1 hypothetical protein PHALS_10478 [Plasmopara halstedii]
MPTLTLSVHATDNASIRVPTPVSVPMESMGNHHAIYSASLPTEAQKPPPKKRGRRRLLQDEGQRKARRKTQCKLNQRRYRARQRGLISMLSLETEGLNDYFRDLQDYRDFLRDYFAPSSAPLSAWNDPRPMLVVNHFLRAFQTGFALHSIESSSLQESFIRLVCAPNLVTQGAMTDGIEALLLQLKRYASYHGALEIRADSVCMLHAPTKKMDVMANEEKILWIFQSKGTIRMRISRDTLMLVYPHVLQYHETIAQRIMGQTIEPDLTTTFYFDAQAKVTKLEQHVDFAGAFLRLLESAEDVATLLKGALISPFSELGLDPQGKTESSLTRGCKQLSLKFILL